MRIIGAIVVATASLALLAGCGSPAQPASSEPASAPASTPSGATASPGGGSTLDDFLQRVSGAELKTYQVVTIVQGAEAKIIESGEFDNSDPTNPRSYVKKVDSRGGAFKVIVVDGQGYKNLPNGELGDLWIKMRPEDAEAMGGTTEPDISQWAKDYADNLKGVDLVGEESIDGVGVTHFRVTMDAAAMGDMGLGDRDAVADVWIDGDGFTRKMVMEMGGSMPFSITTTVSNINEPVDIEAPTLVA